MSNNASPAATTASNVRLAACGIRRLVTEVGLEGKTASGRWRKVDESLAR